MALRRPRVRIPPGPQKNANATAIADCGYTTEYRSAKPEQ
jgi:hypothetical protein